MCSGMVAGGGRSGPAGDERAIRAGGDGGRWVATAEARGKQAAGAAALLQQASGLAVMQRPRAHDCGRRRGAAILLCLRCFLVVPPAALPKFLKLIMPEATVRSAARRPAAVSVIILRWKGALRCTIYAEEIWEKK